MNRFLQGAPSKKVFYGLLGLLILVLLGAGASTVYGTKMLKKTGQELLDLKLQNTVLDREEASLAQAKKDIEKYSDLEQVAKSIVPQEKDQARTVREIVSLARQSGVSLSTITFPESTLGQKPTAAKKGSKTPAAPAGTTQLLPVTGLTGVYAMEIAVESDKAKPITYPQLLDFLKRLEQNRRTSHVTNLSIQPDEEDRNLVTFSLKVNAYIKA
ncbi:MAG TPA: hypothetical protein VK674_03870 [Candidatus Limnocylindria bacterium]|nr:hypothetical protein [Candidatus Limnocylindria bacterium]